MTTPEAPARLGVTRRLIAGSGTFTCANHPERPGAWLMPDGTPRCDRCHLGAEPAGDEQPDRVPDLPCLKCGDGDVVVRYCDGCDKRLYSDPCFHGEREHFHRTCRRCGYGWQTSDAIDANKVCKS